MTQHPRVVTEWMLIRAWVEPAHVHPLRIAVRGARRRPQPWGADTHFTDAEGAASFVHAWLTTVAGQHGNDAGQGDDGDPGE